MTEPSTSTLMSSLRRPAGRLVALALTLTALTACGDRNIRKLTVGIHRDSVLKILAQGGPGTDSTPNVYREERYLHDGQWITMLMYSSEGMEEGTNTVPDAELIPVVLRNDTLTGWGWEHHDSVALANNIVKPPRN